ncbi:MAG TPA: HAD-IA family hydrolase [Gaiellaceae bacterium]|nr:HAD-IA family hydrolase [Gaiellaceae bacterium]
MTGPAVELDDLTLHWQWALDAAGRALAATGHELTAPDLQRHRGVLLHERADATALLRRIDALESAGVRPWLAPAQVTPRQLGLPSGTEACLFDLDGVLTDSGVIHATAWAQVLDDLMLLRLPHETGRVFQPFDPAADYRTYLDGRPRLEGIHGFLASRGISLPDGRPGDPPEAETAYGVAARKGVALERVMHRRGVNDLRGARPYLLATGFAHLHRGVVSASTTTLPMLELARLDRLVEVRVDAEAIRTEGLRSRPAPDLLLTACERLGVDPARAVTFTNSPAGVAAGHAAGLHVIAVGDGASGELLAGYGPDRVVPSLEALLDPQLRAAAR